MSRQSSPVQMMMDKKQFENVEFLNCLGTLKTDDARYTSEIKSRIVMAQTAFIKKKAFFYTKIGLKFKEETSEMLHFEHSFVWCWRRMEKISWTEFMKMKKS